MFPVESPASGASAGSVPEASPQAATEFEIVLGRRHVASVSFLALVVVALCAGGAYWVGKASSKADVVAAPVVVAKVGPTPAPASLLAPAPAPAPVVINAEILEVPLFGQPLKGPLYIQLGSVEKGYAALMAQGVRKVGYPAFVAAGANQNVFRVLVGPFKTAEDYQKAKAEFDGMGLETFSRKYQE